MESLISELITGLFRVSGRECGENAPPDGLETGVRQIHVIDAAELAVGIPEETLQTPHGCGRNRKMSLGNSSPAYLPLVIKVIKEHVLVYVACLPRAGD